MEEVRKYLYEKYGRQRVLEGGLEVHTTIDAVWQEVANEAVRNGVRAADIERNPARAVVRIGKLLEEIDPAHREAFDRMTARKLRGELAEAA